MPKTSPKQKNRVAPFINSNVNTDNNFNILKPSFPSTLTINDLVNTDNRSKSIPNAFIAYRMALVREYRIKNCKLPLMKELSKIAKNSWNTEPKHVKDFYKSLVKDARSVYKQNNVQIVLDKHMEYVGNNQGSGITYDEEEKRPENVNENFQNPLARNSNVENNNNTNIPLADSSPNRDAIDDREYIRILEQIVYHLLVVPRQ